MNVIFNSVQDKFMLSALTIDSDNLSQQSIYSSLKQLKPEAQYRIRCILQSDQVNIKLVKRYYHKTILKVYLFSAWSSSYRSHQQGQW